MFEDAAKAVLADRGINDPTTEQLQHTVLVLHLGEAATIAGLSGQTRIERQLERLIKTLAPQD